jgi:hypothetical protein
MQTPKFNFKTKTETVPAKGKPSHKVVIGVAVHVLAVAAYFYVRYLTNVAHHKVMTAASRAVVAAITSASASTAAATSKVAPVVEAPKSNVQLAASNPSNSVPAKAAPVSLGDSLMAVLSPSAKAETVQAPLQPASAADVASAVPSARQTLKTKAHARRSIFDNDDDTPLTDAQQLSKLLDTRFQNVLDMALKNPDVFGFGSGERPDQATLGEPIVVYTISPEAQKGYQAGQPIKPLLQATNEWIYPVMLDGSIRYMLPIKRVDGKYVASTGSRALAMVYEKIEQRWPASEGFHPQLVVNPNMPNYFFTIPELPQQNLTDMGDMFQYNPTLSPASVILASWQ